MRIPLLSVLLCLLPLAHADDTARCTVGGWVKLHLVDAQGQESDYSISDAATEIPLYALPDIKSDILHTLPTAFGDISYDYIAVELIAPAQQGRFPVLAYAYGSETPQPLHGWLDKEAIALALQTPHLHESPDSASRTRLSLTDGDWLSDMGSITLRNCQQNWVHIDYRQHTRRSAGDLADIPESEQTVLSGWANHSCALM